jgi:hypothetical protein
MALLRGRRLMFCDERKEASQGCQPAVSRRNTRMPILLDVLQESENLAFRHVFQLQFCHRLSLPFGRETQKESPCVTVRMDGLRGCTPLFSQPLKKESVQKYC